MSSIDGILVFFNSIGIAGIKSVLTGIEAADIEHVVALYRFRWWNDI